MNATVSGRLAELWASIESRWGKPSEMLLAVKAAMFDFDSKKPPWMGMEDVARRIGRHVDFREYGTFFLSEVAGEWHVTAVDLEFWADLYHRARLEPPEVAGRVRMSDVAGAMHAKRRWQSFERYRATGLTADHRKLAARLIWDINLWRGDGTSLYVQGKRPLGNSAIEHDVAEAVGWPMEWGEDEDMPAAMKERCWELFDQLPFAVHDILREHPEAHVTDPA